MFLLIQLYISYSQKQLYDLVADVDNYHRFVPYCVESKVLTSKPVTSNVTHNTTVKKDARLTVGFLAFKESYVSEVTCRPYESVKVRTRDRFFKLYFYFPIQILNILRNSLRPSQLLIPRFSKNSLLHGVLIPRIKSLRSPVKRAPPQPTLMTMARHYYQ